MDATKTLNRLAAAVAVATVLAVAVQVALGSEGLARLVFEGYVLPMAGWLLFLGAAVGLHEAGHFAAARLMGLKVESFRIGLGPEIVGRADGSGTRWSLGAVPFGGMVSPVVPGTLGLGGRLALSLSGPLANVVVAAALGLLYAFAYRGFGFLHGIELLGKVMLSQAMGFVDWAVRAAILDVTALSAMSSPVHVAETMGKAVSGGFWAACLSLMKLNMAVGLFNLLPVLPLDGGQAVADVLDRLVGPSRSGKARMLLAGVGALFLTAVFAFSFVL